MSLLAAFHGWFWHPFYGKGYQFWSGIGSDVGEVSIFVGVLLWIRARNCHVRGCWRLHWHVDAEHGHPVCRRHHPDGHGRLDEISRRSSTSDLLEARTVPFAGKKPAAPPADPSNRRKRRS